MEDKEWEIYKTIVEDMEIFLEDKYFTKAKFQPIPEYIKIINDAEEEADGDDPEGASKIFMIENKGHLGFKKDLMENKEGLDYEHSGFCDSYCSPGKVSCNFLLL